MLTHQHSLELLSQVHPDLAKVILGAYDDCSEAGLPFIVIQGKRTQEQQDALYAQGRTAPGKIVTYTRNSRHLSGHAVDLCIVVGGKAIWDVEMYGHLADHLLRTADHFDVSIVWGGTFPHADNDHFELNEKAYPV